ncbi:hypothetical protein PoB_003705800 [Plakobranchus ocellatus]|uniref:Uncharacterized protein n=1 Tax=Plakobranchus ocellatus TaxID=259542 RepID=A0AAV4AT47_9GAST|nr:hypothetical protein PoB_003705800 [Plakobranchus ocellatus]
MCFGLGIGFCIGLIEILPYICLVTVPLLGSFYGAETIYRLSILLIVHSIVIEFIPSVLLRVIPVLSILLFGVLVYLPVSITPWPVVWIYSAAMWITDPLLMIAEVILLQNYVMRMSQLGADEIERDENSSYKYKAAILFFSSLCYAVTASLIYDMYLNATPSQVLSSTAKSSVLNILHSILHMSSSNAQRSIMFLKRFFTPLFLGLLAVRLYSILFIVNKVTRNFFQDDKDSPEFFEPTVREDFEDFSPWKSPLLLKVSIIFMLTQMSGQFLEEWSGHMSSMAGSPYLISATKNIWPSEILFGRLMQVFSVSGFYMWRLYRADDWTWNPWLTPQ